MVNNTNTGTLTSDFCIFNACSYPFNAKELDEESGMYYYSARYYAPPTFISRDPLFEEFPTWSPYHYCYNNPLRFIDPTGLYGVENMEEGGTYKVVAVFSSEHQDTKALGKEIREWRKAGCYGIANELQAHYDAITSARDAGMPMMFVDDVADFAKGMEEMKTNTDIYSLHSHGGNGEFKIGSDKIDKNTNFSDLKPGLNGKTVFINACNITWGKDGKEFIQKFSKETNSTVIGANRELNACYWFNGGTVKSPEAGLLFHMSKGGEAAKEISDVRIHKNKGIRWNGSGGYH